jgi:tetratricopeptide (TPR) repeat protein
LSRVRSNRLAIALLLACAVLICLSPILRNGFVSYDDPDYVIRNPAVSRGLSWRLLAWAFTTPYANNWHPLTWISHAADCTLFGMAPAGHHLTSLLLHAANAALLFLWLSAATGFLARSAFVALAFGLHPLHVESVAWVAERKDVLCGFFFLLALIAYTRYAKAPSPGRYLWVMAALVLALLSKPMATTLPLLLLIADRWPLQRAEPWRRLVREKIPMFAISAAAAAATLWAQLVGGAVAGFQGLPAGLRIENALVSYAAYLGKTIWPVNLAVFYPFPMHGIPLWRIAAASTLLLAISCLAWRTRRDHPWIAAGWVWFVVMLLPVIGLVQAGMQAMADRYLYLPMIGLLFAITWELARLRAAQWAAPFALAACAAVSWHQIPFWRDGIALWSHTLAVTTDNFVAHDNLGVELDALGRPEDALRQYREALRIQPGDRIGEGNYAQANFAQGERLFTAGQRDAALGAFREGLRHRPANALAHSYVAAILTQQNQLTAAIGEFRAALALDPKLARAQMGLGVALARSGQMEAAVFALQESVRDDPSSVEAHYDLGLIEAALGKRDEAVRSFDRALRLDPEYAPARAARSELSRR